MSESVPKPRPTWTRKNATELRQLTKRLREINDVAGVFGPDGTPFAAQDRLRLLNLAQKQAEAMGGGSYTWANAVAWGTQPTR